MDIIKIRNKYLLILITFIVISVGLFFFFLFYPFKDNLKYTVLIIILFIIMGFSFWIKPRIEIINIHLAFNKLINSDDKKIFTASITIPSPRFHTKLIDEGFKTAFAVDQFTLYYKIDKNPQNLTKKGVLLIFIVYKEELSFTNSYIEHYINELENKLQKEKQKYLHYGIMQIRNGKHTNENLKDTDQIRFERFQKRYISTINALVDGEKIYMLYSTLYSPTIYYKYIGETFLKLIK